MSTRRFLLSGAATGLVAPRIARSVDFPGITATEIKVGNTMPYSGPASGYAVIGRTEAAYFRMINDQ